MKKLGIIHTTAATVDSLGHIIKEVIPNLQVINILDDSLLPNMKEKKAEEVRKRWFQYVEILEEEGVDGVLSACSTVGEIAEEADEKFTVPVYRIDRAMIEKAVVEGKKIYVLATLITTLKPTVNLLRRVGNGQNIIKEVLIEGAYDALAAGDKNMHDILVRRAVVKAAKEADVVLLAQASMAAALDGVNDVGAKILASPRLGIQKLKKDLGC